MGSSIGLWDDFDGASLRRLARFSKSANQARRVLALAQIYDGSNRSEAEAAKIGGVTLQIVRDWVILPEWRSPPRGLATALPCSSARRLQRIALEMLTSKWAAAARQLTPPSIAATTRSRRSCESVRAIHAGLLHPAKRMNQNRPRKGIPAESERGENPLERCSTPCWVR